MFRERRQIGYQPIDDRAYALDWETTLTAQADLTLDRTPFTTWGGYGGLNQTGGVAIFDHPANPRHPTPWYGATGPGHYFNAAVVFHEPMSVAGDETLTFRYRVLVHDQIWDVSRLQAAYGAYASGLEQEREPVETDNG